MEDKLRDRINRSPGEYDVYETDIDQLWTGIEDRLTVKKQHSRRYGWKRIMRVAAALLLIGSVSFIIGREWQATHQEPIALYQISPELAEAEVFYASLIRQRMELIQAEVPEDDSYLQDLEKLDLAYAELKNDLNDQADNQEVIEAMIENYQLKLAMLERILRVIDENENGKDQEVLRL